MVLSICRATVKDVLHGRIISVNQLIFDLKEASR